MHQLMGPDEIVPHDLINILPNYKGGGGDQQSWFRSFGSLDQLEFSPDVTLVSNSWVGIIRYILYTYFFNLNEDLCY